MGTVTAARPDRDRRVRERIVWAAAGILALAGVFALSTWSPSSDPSDTVCLLRRTTGLACPGCGMGRAAAALASGEWRRATRLHPLVWPLAAQAVVAWVLWGLVAWERVRAPDARWIGRLALANAGLFVVVWLARTLA